MKFLSKCDNHSIRSVFAVQTGDYVGQMFILVKKDEHLYRFLSIPSMENIDVPKDKFDFAIDNTIIEFVEVIPRNLFKIIERQFAKNEKANNRR